MTEGRRREEHERRALTTAEKKEGRQGPRTNEDWEEKGGRTNWLPSRKPCSMKQEIGILISREQEVADREEVKRRDLL